MIRVLLQQNAVAHYRAPLFQRLSQDPELAVEFVADATSDTPYLPTVEADAGFPLTEARLFRLRFPRMPELYFQPVAVQRLLLGEFEVAIVLGSPYSLTTWLMLALGPLVGTRVLLWTHGALAAETGVKGWLRRLLYRCSSGLLLYGERAARILRDQGLEQTPLFVVRNSLDPDAQAEAASSLSREAVQSLRWRLGLRVQDRALIFVGRLQRVKRLSLLVRATSELLARGRPVHAIFLGEGEERLSLEELSKELGLEGCVHFEGACYDERELARYFAVSDLCVIPSGAGLTVMHALGYGTPVVTCDRSDRQFPEVEAIAPGETGAFFRDGDWQDLADVVDQALFPRPLKARASAACRDRIATDFHPDVQARRMTEAIRRTAIG